MADLRAAVQEAVEGLLVRAHAVGGPTADITETFTDADDYPAFDEDPAANYLRGFVEGAASALGMTSLELLDEFDIR